MADLDRNKDGKVSLEEYISDILADEEGKKLNIVCFNLCPVAAYNVYEIWWYWVQGESNLASSFRNHGMALGEGFEILKRESFYGLWFALAWSSWNSETVFLLELGIIFDGSSNSHPTEGANEPEWVEHERRAFLEKRDKDKDGHLDLEEMKDWLAPEQGSPAQKEAEHLMKEADEDKNGLLSFKEVVKSYKVFVGSQVTDFGRLLHSELWVLGAMISYMTS